MSETMSQGAVLMLLGMGIVFCFLGLLVLALTLMSRLLKESTPVIDNAPSAVGSSSSSAAQINDPELLSAITAAVHSFRAKRDQSSKNTK